MSENVRLVIWDLDETFWQGTLTEGGITNYRAEHEDIVIELARRGIMSSICSKNDFEAIKQVFDGRPVWDYFIFPSIDWTSKGPRIRRMIEAIGLRPATVLFIDDNPNNLAEAQSMMPDLQVANEAIIPTLLSHSLCQGKDDIGLARLRQYKVLEQKHADQAKAAQNGDNAEFLKSCNIRVHFEYDVDKHLDRAVELVNRTNQLNFTKVRLSEDSEAARAELREVLNGWNKTAALVEVKDDYGDYGFVGFYVVGQVNGNKWLEHFCFSCRTIGMGVEAWVYQQLGAPLLRYSGDVLSDPIDAADVTWIEHEEGIAASDNENRQKISNIFLVGGCDFSSISHYLGRAADNVVVQGNLVRDSFFYRKDHTTDLSQRLTDDGGRRSSLLSPLGFADIDCQAPWGSDRPVGRDSILVMAIYGDLGIPIYRFTGGGPKFSLALNSSKERLDLVTDVEIAEIAERETNFDLAAVRAKISYIQRNCEFIGNGLSVAEIEANISSILSSVPNGVKVFVIMPSIFGSKDGEFCPRDRASGFREIVPRLEREFSNVVFVNIEQFVSDPSEILDEWAAHFSRNVYFRIGKYFCEYVDGMVGKSQGTVRPIN